MPLEVKPGYVNPLTMMGKKKNGLTPNNPLTQQNDKHRDVKNLQIEQQSLQNQILLMKSASDSSLSSGDSQKALEQQLEKITSELQTAKSQAASSPAPEDSEVSAAKTAEKLRFDTYERETMQKDSPGLYQLQNDKEKGYKVLYEPPYVAAK